MITTNLTKLELSALTSKADSFQQCRVTFPLLGAHGTKKSATVYFELEPGDHLGKHTDSAEELLYVIEGEVQVTIDSETSDLGQGSIAMVPEMVPHDVKNTGSKRAKVLGFFGGANNIVATFEHAWEPAGEKVVDTAAMSEQAAC